MLASLSLWLAALLLAAWVATGVRLGVGTRRIRFLRDLALLQDEAPLVSLVIAARNEERGIQDALRSVLGQRYPRYEVVVVDDRSTDATGAILDQMALQDPRLRVEHLESVPPGWLGKNHALHRGAAAAAGEWILFTDADVVMHPDTLSRALGHASRERLDHLAAAPDLIARSPALNLFVGTFALFFALFARPWQVRDPERDSHVGVGAFNLVRASAYRALDGHRRISMRPDDDLKLGKILKQARYRQDIVFGRGMIRVEWYASLPEAVRGLEKNAFAGLEYSLPAVLGSSLALLLFNVWPFVALLLAHGLAWWLYLAICAMAVALFAASTRGSGASPWLGLAFPLGTLLFVFTLLRSTALALHRGGIRWRDTFYPLDELRANRV